MVCVCAFKRSRTLCGLRSSRCSHTVRPEGNDRWGRCQGHSLVNVLSGGVYGCRCRHCGASGCTAAPGLASEMPKHARTQVTTQTYRPTSHALILVSFNSPVYYSRFLSPPRCGSGPSMPQCLSADSCIQASLLQK